MTESHNQQILHKPMTNLHHSEYRGNHLTSLHRWWRRRLTSNGTCQECGSAPKWLDLANISGEYKNEATDWKYLCRPCHRKFDKRRVNSCRNGHIYTQETEVIRKDGTRTCRKCSREAYRRWKIKQRTS